MKVAVTGANGFIGRHVVTEMERLSVQGILVCRPSSSIHRKTYKHNVVEMNLRNPPSNAFEQMHCPDVLIHLAWSGLSDYTSSSHFEKELPSQYSLLDGLIRSGLKNLVVVGTCLEYGMQSGPLSEEMITSPTTPYGCAKDTLRLQLENLKTNHPYALTWGRLFYVFGEGQEKHSLWSQLKEAVERGSKKFNMSGGEQIRDYLPVTQVAKILVSFALLRKDVGVVNICSGRPTSVRDLVEGWIKQYGWLVKPNFGYYPYPDYEPLSFWGDRKKLATWVDIQ